MSVSYSLIKNGSKTYLVFCELRIVHILASVSHAAASAGAQLTLYQCFFTLPSVLVGNACRLIRPRLYPG